MSRAKPVLLVVAVLAALTAGLSAQAVSAPHPGPNQCLRHLKPCGPVVKLGTVHDIAGPIEIAARRYDGGRRDGGLCTSYDSRRSGVASCRNGSPIPRHNDGIAARSFNVTSGKKGVTQIYGATIAPVTSIDLLFRRGKTLHQRHAKLVRVKASDLDTLGAAHRFGVFEASIRGCVNIRQVTLRARAHGGKVRGVEKTKRVDDLCDKLPNSDGASIFGTFRHGRAVVDR